MDIQRINSSYQSANASSNRSSDASPPDTELNQLLTRQDLSIALHQGQNIPVSEKQLILAVDRAMKALQGPETSFNISIHEKTNSVVVKVMNKETGEIIREIPNEKILDLVAKMMEFAGILIDERR